MTEQIKALQSQIRSLESDNSALKDQNETNKSLLADLSKGNKQKKKPNEIKFDESNRTSVNVKLFVPSKAGDGSLFQNILKNTDNVSEKTQE
jgi:hypothetical protein